MKIAFIVSSLVRSGPIKVVYQLTKELSKKHDVEIFYFKRSEKEKFSFEVPIHNISFMETIDFEAYDIIHSHGIRSDAYVFFHHTKINRAKTISTLHNYAKKDLYYRYGFLKGFVFVHLWNFVTSRHDRIIVLSKDARDYYLNFWHNKNISYVYNGIEKTVVSTSLKLIMDREILLLKKRFVLLGAIGLLTPIKGFEQIIKALPDLPGYALVVAGSGEEEKRSLRELSLEHNVADRVLFLGFEKNISGVLNRVDIVIIPSRTEGFPLVLLESARQKKPVVCSDIPIFHELFSDDELFFFTLDDIEMLACEIEKATKEGAQYGIRLHNKFLTSYRSRHMSCNYVKQYFQTMEQK